MTRFLPARIFSISVIAFGCCVVCLGSRASPFEVQIDFPGVRGDRTGRGKVVRGLKGQPGAEVETRT
jgi:hypothetical protein